MSRGVESRGPERMLVCAGAVSHVSGAECGAECVCIVQRRVTQDPAGT